MIFIINKKSVKQIIFSTLMYCTLKNYITNITRIRQQNQYPWNQVEVKWFFLFMTV
jgi:hypothetical protein